MENCDNFAEGMNEESLTTGQEFSSKKKPRLDTDVMSSEAHPGVSSKGKPETLNLGIGSSELGWDLENFNVFSPVTNMANETYLENGSDNPSVTENEQADSTGIGNDFQLNIGHYIAPSNGREDSLATDNSTCDGTNNANVPETALRNQMKFLQSTLQLITDQETLNQYFLIPADATDDKTNPAYKLLHNHLQIPLVAQRLINLILGEISNDSTFALDADKLQGIAGLNQLILGGNNTIGSFLALLGSALLRISQNPPVMEFEEEPQEQALNAGTCNETVGAENTAENNVESGAGDDAQNVTIQVHGNPGASTSAPVVLEPGVAQSAVSGTLVSPVPDATSSAKGSIYEELEKVKDKVLALAHQYRGVADTHKMISSCGKIAINGVFTVAQLKAGNSQGRKFPNSEEPVEKLDITKIVTISKFLAWARTKQRLKLKRRTRNSQPSDISMEDFKRYESLENSGLSVSEFKYFQKTVVVSYTSDLRNGKVKLQ